VGPATGRGWTVDGHIELFHALTVPDKVEILDVTSTVLARAQAYCIRRLGSLDAIHLATADPFLPELTGLVTYDAELAAASAEIGIAVIAPR